MSQIQALLKEMEQEANTTRKMLSAIPGDQLDWRPHPKNMTMRQLATHIGELPGWVTMTLDTAELDFAANPYQQVPIADKTELMDYFERTLEQGRNSLTAATEADLLPDWTLRNGDQVYMVSSKGEVIRSSYSQIVHHRAQLGMYLRLLDIPIPGSYGPSADESF